MAEINFYNIDCIEFMKTKPDNHYDLAIVDPPYGIGVTKNKRLNNNSDNDWDSKIPEPEYFEQLFRISKNQIIWGGNYFIEHLKNSRCFINWDKLNHSDTYADCEMAWTSFDKNAKIFKYMWDGNRYGFKGNIKGVGMPTIRTHPTQKPIDLYRWCLNTFAEKGMKILDTHGGSMTIAIACDKEGFDLDICEIDSKYFETGKKRYNEFKQQITMF
jgi:site-specific DNA-methyltransferase (adenine-specific)